tara:strand:- start:553 stop:729 length:177 start_codon:yes stop_codon:yes gene_type:complete
MIADICPKCGREGCMCDPNTCDCSKEEGVIEEQIADVRESIKKSYSNSKIDPLNSPES